MNIEETKKAIEVMQAFVDGKTVGYMRNDGNGNLYFSESESPAWNWFHSNYVIKPQSMKVTEEEKEIINRTIYWTKYKDTGNISYRYAKSAIEPNDEYVLNSATMEWEDWSEK